MNAVFGTTACWPGLHYRDAVAKLVRDTHEPYLGAIGCGQIQLCPQNSGLLDDTEIDFLLAEYPATAFRLHANARVSRHSRPGAGDAIDFRANDPHFQAIIKTSQRLNAAGYTLHSGKRSSGSHNDLRSKVLALQDLMQTGEIRGCSTPGTNTHGSWPAACGTPLI